MTGVEAWGWHQILRLALWQVMIWRWVSHRAQNKLEGAGR